jgi:hypothetical protein
MTSKKLSSLRNGYSSQARTLADVCGGFTCTNPVAEELQDQLRLECESEVGGSRLVKCFKSRGEMMLRIVLIIRLIASTVNMQLLALCGV